MSSDDDLLLPGGRPASRPKQMAPKRLTTLKSMPSDDSDSDKSPVPNKSVALPAPKKRQLPVQPAPRPKPEDDTSASSDDSIDFKAEDDLKEVVQPSGTPSAVEPRVEKIDSTHKAVVVQEKMQSVASLAQKFEPVPRSPVLGAMTKAEPALPPPDLNHSEVNHSITEEQGPLYSSQANDVDEEELEKINEILPLHQPIGFQRPPMNNFIQPRPLFNDSATLSMWQPATTSLETASKTPHREISIPITDSVDELLFKAQQRKKEKDFVGNRAPNLPPRRSASVQGHEVVAGPNDCTTKEVRLHKENQRLSEELAYLVKENQRLKGNGENSLACTAESSKLQLQLELLRQQLKESEVEHQRTKFYLEEQLANSEQHVKELQDELQTYNVTTDQYEAMCREKDLQIAAEASNNSKLRNDFHENTLEVGRLREDMMRQKEDDQLRIERMTTLLDDAKKQRIHLSDLNEKFAKDKEQALIDRRRMHDELKNIQNEFSRDRERHADEISNMRRDIERFKSMLQDKDRIHNTQVAEERRAKELYQGKMLELERDLAAHQQQHDQSLRTSFEENRKQLDHLNNLLQQTQERLRQKEAEAGDIRTEGEAKLQREVGNISREWHDKGAKLKAERDEARESARQHELLSDRVSKERDHHKSELDRTVEVNVHWQRAKDKAESQVINLSTTLSELMEADDQLVKESAALRLELEQAQLDVVDMRKDVENSYKLEQQVGDLLAENDRLSAECSRVSGERNELVTENGKLAEEMLKWRGELRDMISSSRTTPVARPLNTVPLARATSMRNSVVHRQPSNQAKPDFSY